MILKYLTRTATLLKDHDEIRTAFERETKNLDIWIEEQISQRCFISFIAGIVITTIIFAGVFIIINKSSNANFLNGLYSQIGGIL